MTLRRRVLFAAVLLVATIRGQESHARLLTIQEAVERARAFPSIEASEEQVNAAAAGIRIARANYLPAVNALGQVDRATRNNVFGLLLPQPGVSVIPNISGPVLGTDSGTSVWGSAVGVLVSWEPFDFGRRHALIQAAQAARQHAELSAKRTEFDVSAATAAAFLTVLASQQVLRGANAAVDRARVFSGTVKASVDARLRAGADLSRADTELAAAETQLISAEQSVDVAKSALSEYTGLDMQTVDLGPGKLLQLPTELLAPSTDLTRNPAALEQAGVIQESEARLKVLQRTYRPSFSLEVGADARGTGALTSGETLGGANGLGPNYFNVAAAFTVSFPLLALPAIQAQQAQEAAVGRSASATYRQVLANLKAQSDSAQATFTQASRIAAETPKELSNAQTGFAQANAQYHAGLATIVAVAEAQRLLAQAEIDDSLAKLAVWRAWLQIAIAQGDLSRFLAAANR